MTGPPPARAGVSPVARPARDGELLVAVALGGVVGAEGRYGLALLMPHHPGEIGWSTLLINVTGCLSIGVLMVVLLEVLTPHRLARPFLGVGVLGGYTTFSTFAMDVQSLLLAHRPGAALAYVALSLVLGALAVWAGTRLTRRLARGRIARRKAAPGAP
jgi:CrcB protein